MKKKMCSFVLGVFLIAAAAVGYFAFDGVFEYLASWIFIFRFLAATFVAGFVGCVLFFALVWLSFAAFDYP